MVSGGGLTFEVTVGVTIGVTVVGMTFGVIIEMSSEAMLEVGGTLLGTYSSLTSTSCSWRYFGWRYFGA